MLSSSGKLLLSHRLPPFIYQTMAIQSKGDERPESTKAKMRDILVDVSWRSIATNYFHKSVSWFYQRLNGIDGNGKPTDFTPEEREQLQGALCDLADRIRRVADSLAEA